MLLKLKLLGQYMQRAHSTVHVFWIDEWAVCIRTLDYAPELSCYKAHNASSNSLANVILGELWHGILYGHERRQRGEKGRGAWPILIFMHDTANVFFNKHSLCENISTLTNHLSCLLCWLTLRHRGDWGQVEAWVHETDLKFSKKKGIFPKIGVSPKKVFIFTRDSWCSVLLRRALGVRPVRPLTRNW